MKHFPVILLLLVLSGLKSFSQERIVQISTNLGDMKFRLYDDTPKHRDAFIRLAQEGYYNGTLFYRVLKDLLIQGGSKSTKNARPGEKVGFGDPDKKVECEIRPDHFHKRGALCAPRQPDEINPTRQSDISQFYIVKGKVYTEDELDTMELAVNLPIRNSIIKKVYTQEIKDKLLILREQKKVEEFRAIAFPKSPFSPIISTKKDCRVGMSNANTVPKKRLNTTRCQI